MKFICIKCALCQKSYRRAMGRVHEAKKFGWNQYCSSKCNHKARMRGVTGICENSCCKNDVYRKRCQFRRSKSGNIFCSRSCAVTVNNVRFPRRKAAQNECDFCTKEFFGPGKYCSRECKDKGQIISKEKICQCIKEFYKTNKRIPLKRESHHYDAARRCFGNWNNAIRAAGFKPNPVLFAEKCIAKDGHICDSLAEKIVDDWLSARKIQHKRGIPYPGDPLLTVDFVTENYWIEFFGLAGRTEYDKIVKRKQRLAKKYKLPLLEIYPKDLFPVNHLPRIMRNAI